MSRQKNYINNDKKERSCIDCHIILKFSEFNIKFDGRPKSRCKNCENKDQQKYRAQRDPSNYNECPHCKNLINIKQFIKNKTNILAERIRKKYLQKVNELLLKENEIEQLKNKINQMLED